MDPRSGIVTLLSDFGVRDSYVAAMKGKILSVDPSLNVVDISHEIPQGDIRSGAYVLSQAAFCFPRGTVHCAVVDPGVGSSRAALALEAGGHFFVGPDNGLFSLSMETEQEVWVHRVERFQVEGPQTFHGRDLFAPVAARVGAGMSIGDVGPRHDEPVTLRDSAPYLESGALRGEVVHVDVFGNLITNISSCHLEKLGLSTRARERGEGVEVLVGEEVVDGVARTFSSVAAGMIVSYWGSAGALEVAVRDGSAAEALGAARGDAVVCRKK